MRVSDCVRVIRGVRNSGWVTAFLLCTCVSVYRVGVVCVLGSMGARMCGLSYSVGMVACVFVGGRGQRYERAWNERSCKWVAAPCVRSCARVTRRRTVVPRSVKYDCESTRWWALVVSASVRA